LLILRSDRHGTDILDEGGSTARRSMLAMVRFVERVADESSTS
jgi:hypothetical protein